MFEKFCTLEIDQDLHILGSILQILALYLLFIFLFLRKYQINADYVFMHLFASILSLTVTKLLAQ